MVAVPPPTAVTTPVVPTVAMAASLLLHTPLGTVSVKVADAPMHNVVPPPITPALGSGFIVMLWVA
jgi:hypothetical protein